MSDEQQNKQKEQRKFDADDSRSDITCEIPDWLADLDKDSYVVYKKIYSAIIMGMPQIAGTLITMMLVGEKHPGYEDFVRIGEHMGIKFDRLAVRRALLESLCTAHGYKYFISAFITLVEDTAKMTKKEKPFNLDIDIPNSSTIVNADGMIFPPNFGRKS